jgi:tyrosyl-tRNA synthetase
MAMKGQEKTVLDVLMERGFIEQVTDEVSLRQLLKAKVTCYIGFDPTASSFHVGNLVPIMALAQMQKHGHRPIALVGAGTGLVGDPSGKDQMRRMLTREEIDQNAVTQKEQFSRFLDFSKDQALLLNNADWLTKLNYIDFLRDIGVHFSVNRMLTTESVKMRLETGLSFIEFNYQLLQAYDFWHLFKNCNCLIQMGGSDQWGNIVAGIDLIRRLEGKESYGITFPLIMTADGRKMGKTEKGAVWLEGTRTSPYEYYQFWINSDDRDVKRFLALFTFLPMEEVEEYGRLQGADLRKAKEVLAFEATKIVHGEKEAEKSRAASKALFSEERGNEASIPTTPLSKEEFNQGIPVFKLFEMTGLCASGSEARRLIEQGGGYLNQKRVDRFDILVCRDDFEEKGEILLRAGKKKFHRIKLLDN